MSLRIHRLPESVISRIAAGEMIARPSSVIKELVENSVDAQSSEIRIRIRGRLDQSMEVADNGQGIAPEDLVVAMERHATSKLSMEADLDRITTLGFRGEALPSIARVSRLTLTTRWESADTAWRIITEGGKVNRPEPAARSQGTTVLVEDLFYNTPARKKSLGSPSSEIRQARRYVEQYSMLSLPVHWVYSVDERTILDLVPTQSLEERLAALAGPDILKDIVPVNYSAELEGVLGNRNKNAQIHIEGFIGSPERARPSPAHQMHFANGRAIVSSLIIQALRQGYGDLLPPGRHPYAVLFLTMDPEMMDVNVHPTKREVKIYHDDRVFREILRVVGQVTTAFKPTVGFSSPAGYQPVALSPGIRSSVPDGKAVAQSLYGLPAPEAGVCVKDGFDSSDTETLMAQSAAPWQMDRRYIVVPRSKTIIIVDQHAAHERILYEKALGRWGSEEMHSQKLLFPQVLEVGEERVEAYEKVAGELKRIGFEAELFGKTSLIVQGVPQLTHKPVAPNLLAEILDEMITPESRKGEALEALAKAFACRCAVKSGTELHPEEMRRLLEDLFAAEVPHGDPHGRPTYVELRVEDLDRRFHRS
ncbi:MAG: DNA mismatch repair endonuclease MutL [Candidatus Eisenbacteria bacterium]|uniref:DNA mismatch repair protein MutL n=1 Tax=Eiseniibacteriota bacterium TaxID=2212470 RepID=A0A948RUK2_UNCEI|nr:DNA mismatch repair endonuclease MutL [Candidatus Eisenbacteria bacterium]MBU1949714.1 DNA mismatch repair endonuclease MutL [Candidatus Eisenbacteria bacterium]MBU2690256.1 DNA mismatch repair endonuclease MutL [Candidatus Eisenbacteria bacterium]